MITPSLNLSLFLKGLITVSIFVGLSIQVLPANEEEGLEFFLWGLEGDIEIASKTPTRVKDAPGVVSIVTRKMIEQTGARTLGEILNHIPGFDVVRSVGISPHENIYVRGRATFYGESLLILVDGVNYVDHIISSSLIDMLYYNLDNVQKIEVIRGPGSALYGANAFTGVINIITRSGKDDDRFAGTLKYGNLDAAYGDIYKGFNSDKWNFSVFLSYYQDKGDEYKDLTARFGLPVPKTKDPHESTDFNFKGGYESDSLKIDFGVSSYRRWAEDFVPDGWVNTPIKGANNENEHAVDSVFLNFDFNVFNDGNLKLNLNAIDQKWDAFFSIMKAHELPPFHPWAVDGRGLAGGPLGESTNYSGEIQLVFPIGKSNELVTGVQYTYVDVKKSYSRANFNATTTHFPEMLDYRPWKYTLVNSNLDSREIFAIYAQDTISFSDKISTTVGVRHDDYNDFGKTTNPRIAVIYSPDSVTAIKFLAATAFRAPSYVELFGKNHPVSLGNPDLDPETINTYELYISRLFFEKLKISSAVYFWEIEDLITSIPDQTSGKLNYLNIGTQENLGFEFQVELLLNDNDYLSLTYSYTNPEDKETDIDLANVAKNSLSAMVNKGLGEKFDLSLYGIYRSDRGRGFMDTRPETNSYSVVNAQLKWLANENVRIFLQCFNIFDEEYYTPEDPITLPSDTPNRGTEVLLGVRIYL